MFEGGTNFAYWNGNNINKQYFKCVQVSEFNSCAFTALQVLIWIPGSALWSPATTTTPPCLRQETPQRSCLPSEMSLSRYDAAARITYSGDFNTQTHHLCFSLQFRDVPAGPMPPATPKFAYGLVLMKKVLFSVLKTDSKLCFIRIIGIFFNRLEPSAA